MSTLTFPRNVRVLTSSPSGHPLNLSRDLSVPLYLCYRVGGSSQPVTNIHFGFKSKEEERCEKIILILN